MGDLHVRSLAHRDRAGTRWDQCVTRLPRVTPMRIAGKVTMVTVALAAAAALSACTNSEQDSTRPPGNGGPSTTTTTTTATSTTTTSVAAAGNECKADDVKVEGAANAKPTITIPATCKPPA